MTDFLHLHLNLNTRTGHLTAETWDPNVFSRT